MSSIQKFAFLPKKVWHMQTKDFRYCKIWLVWYWDCGEQRKGTLYALNNDINAEPLVSHRFLRTNTNKW